MSKEEDNCLVVDDCSSETCAPVSPFSREGLYFIMFIVILFLILFALLYFYGYL